MKSRRRHAQRPEVSGGQTRIRCRCGFDSGLHNHSVVAVMAYDKHVEAEEREAKHRRTR